MGFGFGEFLNMIGITDGQAKPVTFSKDEIASIKAERSKSASAKSATPQRPKGAVDKKSMDTTSPAAAARPRAGNKKLAQRQTEQTDDKPKPALRFQDRLRESGLSDVLR